MRENNHLWEVLTTLNNDVAISLNQYICNQVTLNKVELQLYGAWSNFFLLWNSSNT